MKKNIRISWEPDLLGYRTMEYKNILARRPTTAMSKPQGLKNLRKFQLKLHFNQDLVPRMSFNHTNDKTLGVSDELGHRIVSK